MADKSVTKLLRKSKLTATDRVRLLRVAHRYINDLSCILSTLSESCDVAANEGAEVNVTKAAAKRFENLEDASERFEEAADYIDSIVELPSQADIR